MINAGLHAIIVILVGWLLLLQLFDVDSTILALRNPHVQVVEVGDEALGLGNLSGWAQKHWGGWWWVIKLPMAIFIPLAAVRLPTPAQPCIILLLVGACGYFHTITKENYRIARTKT